MRHIFYQIAIHAPGLRLALAFLCLVLARLLAAEELVPADKVDLHSRALTAVSLVASEDTAAQSSNLPHNLTQRNSMIIVTGAALVATYGSYNWWRSGFGGGFDTANEGWFGAGTNYGGADKLGHLYSNYAGVRLLTPLFESVGNGRNASVSLAAWSTLGIYTAVEIVDGYSRTWKFSPQDAIANAAGAALGVAIETRPELDAIFDFRIDYRRSPRSSSFDPFGDYSEQRYLFVAKGDGFAPLRNNKYLRYFEVAFGYGTRGYDTGGARSRDAYLGLSLNLARLLADGAYDDRMHTTSFQRGTDRLFELVQLPAIAYTRKKLD